MKELSVVVPTGALGFGMSFKEEPFHEAVRSYHPDLIGAQGASADCGPLNLAAGIPWSPKSTPHDVEQMLTIGREANIPVIFSGAMGSGRNSMVDRMVALIKKIAAEKKLGRFKMAVIYSDVTREFLIEKLRRGKIKRFGMDRDLTEEEISKSNTITLMMGAEPIIEAFKQEPDVIVTGRCTDSATFAALPLKAGFDPALAWHFGKTIECGTACCRRARGKAAAGGSTLLATIKDDHFLVEAVGDAVATEGSVITHSLYERADPIHLLEPGIMLNLSNAKWEKSDRAVRVSGAKLTRRPYDVIIEGTTMVGYRSIAIFGVRDPILIKNINSVLSILKTTLSGEYRNVDFQTYFHVYGKNAIMEELEPSKDEPHEIAVVMEIVCKESLELATEICYTAQGIFHHTLYEGVLQISGNLCALCSYDVFTPAMSHGVAYNWSIYDVLELEDPCEPFPIALMEI